MKSLVKYVIAFGFCFILLYLIPLNSRGLWQPDEMRYAEISREMLLSKNWIVPHFLDLRYFEKPILGYWINTLSQFIFGHNNFAVRFGSVFCTTLSALMVAWLAFRLWRDRTVAVLSAVIFLTCFLVYGVGSYAVLDPMVTLCLTAAMCCFWVATTANTLAAKVGGYILLGFACGLGVMSKGFLALAIPVISVLPWVILQKRWKELFLFGPIAVVSAVLIVLPWALAIARAEPDYWHYFFWVEHIQRFAEDDAQHKAPFWYYIPILMAAVLPWLALLPGSLLKGWRERVQRPELFFLLSWVMMPLIFFSIAKGKLPTYILPCMAPLALLMAAYAEDYAASLRSKTFKINALLNGLFGLICVVALLVLGSGLLPKVKLFGAQEWPKIVIGIIMFGGWLLFAIVSARNNAQRWRWAAACPLLLCLLVGYAIPQQVTDSKLPQNFISVNMAQLGHSRYVLTDSAGVAAGLAWELKRSDVLMFSEKGEVAYGLAYPDSRSHFISDADFPQWLAQARKQGDVSLVLQLSRGDHVPQTLPAADKVVEMNRLALLWYQQQP